MFSRNSAISALLSARKWVCGLLLTLGVVLGSAPRLCANVYATNVRLNNSATNINVGPGNPVNISYILNEAATAGVRIDISSSNNTVRTLVLTNGGPGALLGTNVVTWDGKDGNHNDVPAGSYTVSITAAANGYGAWTQISNDATPNKYVWSPGGIAINKNTNSAYYGRVFVANAYEGINSQFNDGDKLGLQKWNADGSPAQEGGFSSGGWMWSQPQKVEVGADDRVYVSDVAQGVLLSFDEVLSTNSLRVVLNSNNYPSNSSPILSGLFLSGASTNRQVWMTDDTTGGFGIRRWNIAANGSVATNDTGITVVSSGALSDLDSAPQDVALDSSNRIYTIQYILGSGDPSYRLFRFPAYNESGIAETNSDWKVGSGNDNMGGANGVAVDPTGSYVAVAFRGINPSLLEFDNGSASVFAVSNGAPIVTLTPLPYRDHTDIAWDNAGNLYATDNDDNVWRVYSPPGTNQATTIALAAVQVVSFTMKPVLMVLAYSNGVVALQIAGEANATYTIQSSSNLLAWDSVATNSSPNATRQVTLGAPLSRSFYRAFVGP